MMETASRFKLVVLVSALTLVVSIPLPAAAQVCGNGIVEAGEECDDGADFRLDGCAPDCSYEHVQQMTLIEIIDGTAPASCTPNTR